MMEVKMNDPTNRKVYGYVTEEYFYKALQRAKVENLYTDANGRTDINRLIQLMWETFSNGSYIILPNHECRAKVTEYITKITSCTDEKIEAVADMIIEAKPNNKNLIECPYCHGKSSTCEDCMGSGYIIKPKARKSRAKSKMEIDPTLVEAGLNITK
jgi:hypothetical protein